MSSLHNRGRFLIFSCSGCLNLRIVDKSLAHDFYVNRMVRHETAIQPMPWKVSMFKMGKSQVVGEKPNYRVLKLVGQGFQSSFVTAKPLKAIFSLKFATSAHHRCTTSI